MKGIIYFFSSFEPKVLSSFFVAIMPILLSFYLLLNPNIAAANSWLSTLCYVSAAMGFSLLSWSLILFFKKLSLMNKVEELAQKTTLTKRLLSDRSFRTIFSTYGSLVITIVLAILKTWLSLRYFSSWFGMHTTSLSALLAFFY